jgi:hypothetical protein
MGAKNERKPLMIDADIHNPIMELSPEDWRNRETVSRKSEGKRLTEARNHDATIYTRNPSCRRWRSNNLRPRLVSDSCFWICRVGHIRQLRSEFWHTLPLVVIA